MKKLFSSIHPVGWTIIVGTLFVRLASSMSMPFLAIYLTKEKGISPGLTGAIVGMSALVGVFGGFIGGALADRYGRKKMMLFAITLSTFVFAGFALADSIVAFFILNMLNGMGRSFFEPSSRAILSDLTKRENRLFIFNLRYAAINVGVAIGPLIGLWVGSAASSMPFFVTAIVYLLYGIILALTLSKYKISSVRIDGEQRITIGAALDTVKKDYIFLLSIIGIIFATIGYSQLTTTLPQYFANTPAFKNGVAIFSYMLTLNAIIVLIVQYPVTRIGKRYSALISIVCGAAITALGLLGIGAMHSLLMIALCVVIFTIGEVMMFSMSDLFVDELAPAHMKATYFGAMGFTNVGGALGPWIGGILFSYFGYEHSFLVFSILSGICVVSVPLLLFVRLMIRNSRKLEQKTGTDIPQN